VPRNLLLPEESAGLIFTASRAFCLDDEEIEWLGEAKGSWQLPDTGYAGIVFNDNRDLRRRLLQDLDLSCIQILYFHNPFQLFIDDLLNDIDRLERESQHNVPDDSDCELISSLHGLRALNLTESNITDDGLRLVCEVQSLESLSVSYTNVTDAAIESIAKLVDLRELDLSITLLSDEGLAKVGELRTLEELRLSSTGISEDGIVHLLNLQKLKFLDVSETAIAEDGIAILQAALGNCQIYF